MWFIFFFKQKTAYEMRISDWSSDVCSSDLMMTCAGPMAGDSALPGGYVFDVTKGAISGVRAFDPAGNEATIGRVVVVDGFAIYDRIETRPEIGRASCRERVCTYV